MPGMRSFNEEDMEHLLTACEPARQIRNRVANESSPDLRLHDWGSFQPSQYQQPFKENKESDSYRHPNYCEMHLISLKTTSSSMISQ